MKKNFTFLTIIFIVQTSNIFAQGRWLPKENAISVLATVSFTDWSECAGNVHNTTSTQNKGIGASIFSSMLSISRYYHEKDSFYISWSYPGDGYFFNNLSFTLDTFQKKIRNLNIDAGRTPDGFEWWESSMYCSEINYDASGDTLITAKESRNQLSGKITVKKYNHTTWGNCNQRLAHYGTSEDFQSLLQDTSAYSCSLTLYLERPINYVKEEKFTLLKIGISLTDHTANFTFHPFSNSQSLLIYDILGREAARAEIPAGAAEYTLPTSRLASGYYFARLGNMSGHFEVYYNLFSALTKLSISR